MATLKKNKLSLLLIVALTGGLACSESTGLPEGLQPPSQTTSWGSEGSEAGQLNFPWGITIDGAGDVFVADTFNHRIQKFSPSGEPLFSFGRQGLGEGEFQTPKDIAVDVDGFIYVLDSDNHRVQKFDASGNFILTWGEHGGDPGQFRSPTGIAVTARSEVFVADYGNGRLQRFDTNGQFQKSWLGLAEGAAVDYHPSQIKAGSEQDVFVVDSFNLRIVRYSRDGEFLGSFGGSERDHHEGKPRTVRNDGDESGDHRLDLPSGLSVDRRGRIYVTVEEHHHRVHVFSTDGEQLVVWGSEGHEPGNFRNPIAIAVAPSGEIYVADSGNHRIQKFEPLD